jgi:hypothetical protein
VPDKDDLQEPDARSRGNFQRSWEFFRPNAFENSGAPAGSTLAPGLHPPFEGVLMENRIGVFGSRASSQPGAAVSDTLHAAAGLAGLQMARRR